MIRKFYDYEITKKDILMSRLFRKIVSSVWLIGVFFSASLVFSAATETEKFKKSSESAVVSDDAIYATYALKNTLGALVRAYPELPITDALSVSPLSGEIFRQFVQLHAYGKFNLVVRKKPDGREFFEKVFETDTDLNKMARHMFDVLDGIIRTAVPIGNPFLALNAVVIAKMIQTIQRAGMLGLIDEIVTSTQPFKERKKAEQSAVGSAKADDSGEVNSDIIDEWWKSYKDRPEGGKLVERVFKKRVREFGQHLQHFYNEAETVAQKKEAQKIFLRLLMTFLYIKDEKEGLTNPNYAIETYFKELAIPFERLYYTKQEQEAIGQALLGEAKKPSLTPSIVGVEDFCFYLTAFLKGDFSFLKAPFTFFVSTKKNDPENRFNGKDFANCAEVTIESIVNVILYNPDLGIFDCSLLPPAVQATFDPLFLEFFQKYNDPKVLGYYKNSLLEWLTLISNIKTAQYKNMGSSGPFELNAAAGPQNLIAVLNHIFGTKADSFPQLGVLLSTSLRTIQFEDHAFSSKMTILQDNNPLIVARVETKTNIGHADFSFDSEATIMTFVTNKTFVKSMLQMCNYTGEDLSGLIFNPSVLNCELAEGEQTPLQYAIYENFEPLAKAMLFYGADPNVPVKEPFLSPLQRAIRLKNIRLVVLLLQYHAQVTQKDIDLAFKTGDVAFVKNVIEEVSATGINIDVTALLQSAIYSGSLPLVMWCLEKGADSTYKDDQGRTMLHHAVFAGFLPIVDFLLQQNVELSAVDNAGKTPLFEAVVRGHFPIVKLLVNAGATCIDSYCNDSKFVRSLFMKEIILRYLIDKHAISFNATDPKMFQIALQISNFSTIVLLLKNGIPISFDGLVGAVTYLATEEEQQILLDLLIKRGDFAHLSEVQKKSIMTEYVKSDAVLSSTILFLMNHTFPVDHQLQVILNVACMDGNVDLANAIIAQGAQITDDHKETALEEGNFELLELLKDIEKK